MNGKAHKRPGGVGTEGRGSVTVSATVKNLPIKKNLISTGNEGRRAINVRGENDLWGEEKRVWVVGERLAYHKLMNYQFSGGKHEGGSNAARQYGI